jgi:succinate-acetate transporter protein
MSELSDSGVGTAAIEPTGPEPPMTPAAAPMGVLLGAGGDPLMIGLPIFTVGSFVLAFVLIGAVGTPAASLGMILPVALVATGLLQFVSAIWAIFLGQSIVACIFGTFSGFWFSVSLLILGAQHNWFLVPVAEVAHWEEIFFIAWALMFFFLTIISLRLPVIYPAIVGLVCAAVVFVILGLYYPASTTTFFDVAGGCAFAFIFLGFWAWLNVGSVALGGPARPPLGPTVIKGL